MGSARPNLSVPFSGLDELTHSFALQVLQKAKTFVLILETVVRFETSTRKILKSEVSCINGENIWNQSLRKHACATLKRF